MFIERVMNVRKNPHMGTHLSKLVGTRHSFFKRFSQQQNVMGSQGIVGCTPGPTYPVMGNPYIRPVSRGYLWVIPKNPKVELNKDRFATRGNALICKIVRHTDSLFLLHFSPKTTVGDAT